MDNSLKILSGLLTVLLLAGGISLWTGFLEVPDFPVEEKVLYSIDSDQEWDMNRGVLWTRRAAKIQQGRFSVADYGRLRLPGYKTFVKYRTRTINATGKPIRLDKLEAHGHVGDNGYATALTLAILDCSRHPSKGSLAKICDPHIVYQFNPSYEQVPSAIEPGDVSVEKKFSDLTVDGYLNIVLGIGVNTTRKVDRSRDSYWDSVRLTGVRVTK
ncbi:MAG: hypothetical protein ABEJ66_03195 [Candidatus Nanohaloarchaea archaeon]